MVKLPTVILVAADWQASDVKLPHVPLSICIYVLAAVSLDPRLLNVTVCVVAVAWNLNHTS